MVDPQVPGEERSRRSLWLWVLAGVVTVLLVACVSVIVVILRQEARPVASPSSSGTSVPQSGSFTPLSGPEIEKLPAAVYDAVIPGLSAYTGDAGPITKAYTVKKDVPVYKDDLQTPVARISQKDFVGADTTVVGAGVKGAWTLVLTAARVVLPSRANGNAPAQSAGWVRTTDLVAAHDVPDRVVISVGAQTLTIMNGTTQVSSFPVGVGTPETPTPTNATGFMQQRYLDPKQDQTVYPIQLTTLHATAQDEPYGGTDGGLIGIHYNPNSTGAVSHGCVRLPEDAITAVNQLPLGTPVTIVP